MARALLVLLLIASIGSGAHAQVFRARSKTGALHPVATPIVTAGGAVAKAPAPATKTPAPAVLAAKTTAKAHVAAKKPAKKVVKKKGGDDDDVVVVDDDDDN